MLVITKAEDLKQLVGSLILDARQEEGLGLVLLLETAKEERVKFILFSIQETQPHGDYVVISHRLGIGTEEA